MLLLQAGQSVPEQLPPAWAGEQPGGRLGTVTDASLCRSEHTTAGGAVDAQGGWPTLPQEFP
jgi:hypothetical protein